ncbi:MAG: hypothetical protein Q9218_004008 [Villophora microphyllina]
MDIARSIDFDSAGEFLHDPPPVPLKDHGIGVNRQFDLYTTKTNSISTDAPPTYRIEKSQDSPTFDALESSNPSRASKYILKTIPHPHTQPWEIEANYARRPGHTSRSSQHSRIEPAPKPHLDQETMGRLLAQENTIFCELAGASMNFTKIDETMPGQRSLVKGASSCSVRVASRKKRIAGDEFRIVRSIWTISDDGETCIQQKLPHDAKIIPYTLWASENKVIIHHPTELRYYADPTSTRAERIANTTWATYAFPSLSSSSEFQSALLFPLQLVKSLPTRRTMRLHPSPFIRAFSPTLQLCGLENLRIFRDLTDPNCLVCLIHYSPNFLPSNGEEYIVFRIYPPPRNNVRIREDGERRVKIKGLDIRGTPASELQKQKKKGKFPETQIERLEEEAYGSESVEKILIEFDTGNEKKQFLELTRELQGLSSW